MAYDQDNIFAKIIRGDAQAHTVFEDDATIAFLDVMPQSDGHTLVLPKTPAIDLFDLDDDAGAAVLRTTKFVARAVDEAFEPDGIRLMQFNRPAAGQTVFHFHMHILPCYEGVPMRGHGRGLAENDVLEAHAERIRAAVSRLSD